MTIIRWPEAKHRQENAVLQKHDLGEADEFQEALSSP
jgi:hypothetical protein